MKSYESLFKRVFSLLLAALLLCSSALPNTAVIAHAQSVEGGDVEPSSPTDGVTPTTTPTAETEEATTPIQETTSAPTVEPTTEPAVEPTTEPTSEPTTEPTTEVTEEPTTEPSQSQEVSVKVTAVNADVADELGNVFPESFDVQAGTEITFQVLPLAGCELEVVSINENSLMPNPDGTYTLLLETDTEIIVTAKDVTPPTVIASRMEDGYCLFAHYSISVSDNLDGPLSLVLTDANGDPLTLTETELNCYAVLLAENGEYTLTASDNAGLQSVSVITEDKIDTAAPALVSAERITSGWTNSAASYMAVITDPHAGIASVSVSVNDGISQTVIPGNDGSYIFAVSENGTICITATDVLGNTDVFTIQEEQLDKNMPDVKTPVRQASGWAVSATYTFTAEDLESGIAQVMLSEQITQTAKRLTPNEDGVYAFTADGNGTYTVTVLDNAGNTVTASVTEDMIDKDAPVISACDRITEGWSQQAQYRLVAEDTLSGIAQVCVSETEGSQQILVPGEDGSYSITVHPGQQLAVTVTDLAGNTVTTTIRDDLTDAVSPSILSIQRLTEGWSKDTAMYLATITDDLSGIASVILTVGNDAGTPIVPNADGTYSFTLTENAEFSISVLDAAGNKAEQTMQEMQIDLNDPEVSEPSRNVQGWVKYAGYSFQAKDLDSGIREMKLVNSEGMVIPILSDSPGNGFGFIVRENGTYTLTVTDQAGRTLVHTFTESNIDTAAPEIIACQRQEDGWVQKAVYVLTVQDAQSGVAKVTVADDSGNETELRPNDDGSYSVTLEEGDAITMTVTDYAGNICTAEITDDHIDVTAPSILSLERVTEGWHSHEAEYKLYAEDTQSGIAQLTATVNGKEVVLTQNADGSYTFCAAENGTILVCVTDAAGNMAETTDEETELDLVDPVLHSAIRLESDWATSATYVFTASDLESGLREILLVRNDTEEQWSLSHSESGTFDFTLTENGSYTLVITDNAMRSVRFQIEETQIDTQAPALDAPARHESGWATQMEYTVNVADLQSGIASVKLLLDGGEYEVLELDENGSCRFIITQNGTYTVVVTDNVGNSAEVSFEENAIDTIAPVLSDFARLEQSWTQKAIYSFQVSDPQSGIESVFVTIGDDVQVLTEENGIYSFAMDINGTFSVTAVDLVGNTTQLTGEETLVDTTAPAILDAARTLEGWLYSAEYTFRVEELQSGIQKVTVESESGTLTLSPDESGICTFVAEHNGNYTITAIDTLGNTATITLNESLIDVTPPEVSDIHRTPDIWSQDATYSFRADDTQSGIATVSVMLGDLQIPVTLLEDTRYSFPAVANGSYIICVMDSVGNETKITVGETLIDLVPPQFHTVTAQDIWDADSNTIRIAVTDESELASVTVENEAGESIPVNQEEDNSFLAVVTENGSYVITATDRAGNSSTTKVQVWHIDTEAPSAPVLESSGAEKWVNTDVTIYASSTDSQSGVVRYWYSTENVPFDPAVWQKMVMNAQNGEWTFSAEQDMDYYVVAEDGVGRFSDSAKIHVSIDKTAPKDITLVYETGEESGYRKTVDALMIYNDKASFHAAASDAASGVVRYEYRIDVNGTSGDWTAIEADEIGIFQDVTGEDAIYQIYVRAYDLAGNCSAEFTLQDVAFVIENTPSTDDLRSEAPALTAQAGTASYDSAWTNENVTITVSGSAAVSGICGYEYRIDYADPAMADIPWMPVAAANGNWTVAAKTDTNAVYYFRAVTHAGNTSQEQEILVRVQKTAPAPVEIVADAATGNNGWYTVYPSYQILLPQQGAYAAPVHYILRSTHDGQEEQLAYDGSNAPVLNKDGVWDITLTAVDAAGNTAALPQSSAHFQIDTKVPDNLSVLLDGEQIINLPETGTEKWENTHTSTQVTFSDFTIFRRKTITLTVAANGGDSNLAGLYYQCVSDNASFDSNGDWTPLGADGKLELKPNRKCHLFFMAEDTAGNKTLFSAQSILLDSLAPGSEDPNELDLHVRTSGLSAYGFYSGDVVVDIRTAEPISGEDFIFSGLKSVTYRVLKDGEISQQGQLYPGSGEALEADGRVGAWSGSLTVDAQRNDSNNIAIEVTVVDQAGNSRTERIQEGKVRIDITKPVIEAVYENNTPAANFQNNSCFTGNRVLTVTVQERNFLPEQSFVTVTDTDTGKSIDYTWSSTDDLHTVVIPVTADGHYTVAISAADAAGNKNSGISYAEGTVAPDAFVIDNTLPVIRVSYDNNTAANEIYFNYLRAMTVQVTDRNFDPQKMVMSVVVTTPDGTESTIRFTSWRNDGYVYYATAVCDVDGVYTVKVSGSDALGNAAAQTSYQGTATTQWVLDTAITAPVFSDVADGAGYAGTIIPIVSAVDTNIEDIQITLHRSSLDVLNEDVTEQFLSDISLADIANGKQAVLDIFANGDCDGIYTLTATSHDKAGNTNQSSVQFSVNRNGSVYAYDEYLVGTMNSYLQELENDLVIAEYNASGVLAESQRVTITKDGTPVADVQYTVQAEKKPGGWYEYRYVISKENFKEDGIYEVVISTQDAAGNLPENTEEGKTIRFGIDTTAPELPSVTGLEEAIYRADSISVMISALDNVALDSITVYIDDVELVKWTDLESYVTEQEFRVPSGFEQHVRIVVTDKAGNSLDTDAETFEPGYAFQEKVTVSTNLWLRYYANKPLFFGSIGLAAAAGGGAVLLATKKKKPKESKQ